MLLTTVNAALQRVPARDLVGKQSLSAAPGNVLPMDGIIRWLELNGFTRASTVREPGDYAVRGGILDLFAPGMAEPVRLDFFGDTLESIRSFDPETQRTNADLRALDLVPVAEFQLTTETIRRFRTGYVAAFGAAAPDDLLYEAVSEGRRHPGMEHWLPLFHDQLDTLFDYRAGRAGRARAAGRGRRARAARADHRLLRGAQGRRSIRRAAARPTSRCRRTGSISPKPNGASGSTPSALARLTPFAAPERTRDADRHRRPRRPQFRRRAHRAATRTCSRR